MSGRGARCIGEGTPSGGPEPVCREPGCGSTSQTSHGPSLEGGASRGEAKHREKERFKGDDGEEDDGWGEGAEAVLDLRQRAGAQFTSTDCKTC